MRNRAAVTMRRFGIVGVLLAAGLAIGFYALRPVPPRPIIGMVRATEIKIAPEVSGRIVALPVAGGQQIAAGAVIAELSNPELAAAVNEAEATVLAAKAARDRVYAGVRVEEVGIAAQEINKAKADQMLAQQQYRRIADLVTRGNAAQQALDSARAGLDTATARLQAAELRHAAAQSGPTKEERDVADAGVATAEAALTVLQRRAEKLQIKSPVNGTVEVVVGELGEATVPGRTILTIIDREKPWFSFNIREDQLHGLGIGSMLTLIDGLDGQHIAAQISEMRRLGDFATWRAARAVGDHDLNTFSIRADAPAGAAPLPPGVTVWIASGDEQPH